ncbi:MAG: CvpA family protein [Bacteroidales bacterium]|nr:CvpA family protein [Bacteroidales bacterium]
MNILDIILLVCFIPAVIQGLRKGFIAQAISIVSIILGVWASARFANVVSAWIAQYLTASDQILKIVAFALILVAVFLVLGAIGKLLEATFKLVMLDWVNKLLGMVFAMLKTALIVGLVIMAFNSLNETFHFVKDAVLQESVMYPPLKKAAYEIFPYLKDMLTLTK